MLSETIRAAARGELPPWAVASPKRREHIARVAALMEEWAGAAGLPPEERDRWVAAAWLHDALRDADPEQLRAELPEELRDFPGPLLHGPAAAERLKGEADEELRNAVRYHTLGHPSLGRLGKALYLADFLEPGRDFEVEWRAALRARMPEALDEVAVEVVAARIRYLLEGRKPVRPETAAYWTALVGRDRR
ncbi:MAG: HD domain-containing protein [Gemmatimonadota bacterium]|nr:HD domain-containing protein [Gemmatimonadota bacterium]